MSAWPCELSEKLSKAGRIWEDFKNLAGLAASRVILCDTFIRDAEPQMFDLFPPLLNGALRSLESLRRPRKYRNRRVFQLSLNGGHLHFQITG